MNAVPETSQAVKDEVERLFKKLTSAQGQANPYPVYEQLRTVAPVYVDATDGVLTRYDDIQAIIRNPAPRARPGWTGSGRAGESIPAWSRRMSRSSSVTRLTTPGCAGT